MNSLVFRREDEYPFQKKFIISLFSVLLIPIIILIFGIWGFSFAKLLFIVSIPLLLVTILSFETMLFLSVASLFLNFTVMDVQISVYIIYTLFLSYLLTHKKFEISSSLLLLPFSIYLLSIIPSFFNTADWFKSLFHLQNLISIYLIAFILHNYFDDFEKVKKLFGFLLVFSMINAIYAVAAGIATGQRSWGFAGLAHVDYLSLLAFIMLLASVVEKGFKKTLFIIGFVIFFLAVVFTQTRSMFVTFGLSFLSAITYLFFNSRKFNLSKVKMFFFFFASIIVTVGIILALTYVNPDRLSRVNELQNIQSEKIEYETDLTSNSLLTRVLIWHTAYNAFVAHPIIGIGIYSFQFSSEKYHQLPSILYEKAVKGLSPHVTYFAVITETGLIGLTGFLFLIFSLLKVGLKNVKQSFSKQEKFYSLIISFALVYIIISMFVTDAWLWGQCGLLWGMAMGVLSGTNKILMNNKRHYGYI